MSAAIASAAEVRRLYGPGFEGWDYSQSGYLTAYVVMLAGFLTALGVFHQWQGPRGNRFGVFAQFLTFALLEGTSYLLCGMTVHLLATYQERGQYMGRAWGAWNSQWMWTWTLFMVAGPLASSLAAGVGFASANVDMLDTWYQLIILAGGAVGLYEVYLCANNMFGGTGLVLIVWGTLTSIVGVIGVAAGRLTTTGAMLTFLGLLLRSLSYTTVLLAQPSCRMAGIARQGCWFPEVFNQNAFSHLLLAAAVVALYLGVLAKNAKDRDNSYQDVLQARAKDGRDCCKLPFRA